MREKIIANEGTNYNPYIMIMMITALLASCLILYKYIQRRLEEEKERAISPDDPNLQRAQQNLQMLLNQSTVLLQTQGDKKYKALVHILETDPALRPFLSKPLTAISNPLILAYMKKVSQRIFSSKASHAPVHHIIYGGAYVDLLTPLQLTMEGNGPFEIFMMDNASNYQMILDPFKENASKNEGISSEKEAFIRRTLRTQNYFASVEAGDDLSGYLKFLLDQIKPTNITVYDNRLSFNFQGKAYTFTFIQADITDVEDVMQKLEDSSSTLSPCVYIQKATMGLEYSDNNHYLERLLTRLNPIYCFLSTQSNNLRFHDDLAAQARADALQFKQRLTGNVSQREVSRALLPYKFLDNPTPQSLIACRHPTLNFFQFAAMEIDIDNPAFLVTGYHLPTLLRGPGQ